MWRPVLTITERPASPSTRTQSAGRKVRVRAEAVASVRGPFFSLLPLLLGLMASHENEFYISLFEVHN